MTRREMLTRSAGLTLALGVGADALPAIARASRRAASSYTLDLAAGDDPRTLDSIDVHALWERAVTMSTCFETLVRLDRAGRPRPGLAKSWSTPDNGRTWIFEIQKGVRFHDGTAFNAKSIQGEWGFILDPKSGSQNYGDLGLHVAGTSRKGLYTLVVHLKNPNVLFPLVLATIYQGSPAWREKVGREANASHPVGTGPYQFVSWTPGQGSSWKRFDKYWRGRPPLDNVNWHFLVDGNAAALNLQAGALDMLPQYLPAQSIPAVQGNKKLTTKYVPSSTWYHMEFNFWKDYGGDAKFAAFRKGIAQAFDVENIVPNIIGPFGIYAATPIPKGSVGYNAKVKKPAYDPTAAKASLTAAGFPPGSTINALVYNQPYQREISLAFQSEMSKLGYTVNLTGPLSSAAALVQAVKYSWDVLFVRASGRADPGIYFSQRFYGELAQTKLDFWTYHNNKFDDLVTKSLTLNDDKQRGAIYSQLQQILINDDLAAIGLYMANDWWSASNDVVGWWPSPDFRNSITWSAFNKITKA
jgi:peptide/nickel transport system substrate-binding protein